MLFFIRAILIFLINLFFISSRAFADDETTFNLTPGVTPISRDIYNLHMTIFYICVIIGVVVFGIMFYSLFKHRKSRGVQPAKFHGHTKVEIFWAVIPFLILVIMAIPATAVLVRMSNTEEPDVNIKITGYQWKWKYEYLDEGISYFSNLATPQKQLQNKLPKDQWYLREVDKPLVIPIHKKIRFLITSNDVIHSWWVPALGIKRDAMPGFIYEAWAKVEKPGIYRGQCAELCGTYHAYMPIVVQAVSWDDYQKWVAANKPTATNASAAIKPAMTVIPAATASTVAPTATVAPAPTAAPAPEKKSSSMTKQELMQLGENVYETNCAMCHKSDGSGMPPAFPAMKGSKIATGPVAAQLYIVLHGKPGTPMQSFADQLTDQEIAAVITYERNSWGNEKHGRYAGGLVQPADVEAAKRK